MIRLHLKELDEQKNRLMKNRNTENTEIAMRKIKEFGSRFDALLKDRKPSGRVICKDVECRAILNKCSTSSLRFYIGNHDISKTMSQEDMKEALLKFVVASRQPISLVDGPRFKKAFVPKYQGCIVKRGARLIEVIRYAEADTPEHDHRIIDGTEALFDFLPPAPLQEELNMYSLTAPCPNFLVFWKQHESMFPRLSVLAKFLFGWQPSSAPSERTFKELRYVVENFTRTIPRGIIDSSRKELLHLFIHDLCF